VPTTVFTDTLLGVADRFGRDPAKPAHPETQLEIAKIASKLLKTLTLLLRSKIILIYSPDC